MRFLWQSQSVRADSVSFLDVDFPASMPKNRPRGYRRFALIRRQSVRGSRLAMAPAGSSAPGRRRAGRRSRARIPSPAPIRTTSYEAADALPSAMRLADGRRSGSEAGLSLASAAIVGNSARFRKFASRIAQRTLLSWTGRPRPAQCARRCAGAGDRRNQGGSKDALSPNVSMRSKLRADRRRDRRIAPRDRGCAGAIRSLPTREGGNGGGALVGRHRTKLGRGGRLHKAAGRRDKRTPRRARRVRCGRDDRTSRVKAAPYST
jgi:hypothetical protein